MWVATANVKELRIEYNARGRRGATYVSILHLFDELAARGVELRLLHAAKPSRAFVAALASLPRLRSRGFAMRCCPRVHLKIVAVDGAQLYIGSANLTGAGLGAKGEGRRNFEMGIVTDDEILLDTAQERFDRIWSGAECRGCKLRAVCPKPLDTL